MGPAYPATAPTPAASAMSSRFSATSSLLVFTRFTSLLIMSVTVFTVGYENDFILFASISSPALANTRFIKSLARPSITSFNLGSTCS